MPRSSKAVWEGREDYVRLLCPNTTKSKKNQGNQTLSLKFSSSLQTMMKSGSNKKGGV
jgi:hypothetical protein